MTKQDRINELIEAGDYEKVLDVIAGRRDRVFGQTPVEPTPAVAATVVAPTPPQPQPQPVTWTRPQREVRRRKPRADTGVKHPRADDRRRQIVEFIEVYFAAHYRPPTLREIGDGIAIPSKSTLSYHIHALARDGKIFDAGDYGESRRYIPSWVPEVVKSEIEKRRKATMPVALTDQAGLAEDDHEST